MIFIEICTYLELDKVYIAKHGENTRISVSVKTYVTT